jgi:tetratricopeptide (TPR) repeat protein
LFLPYGAPKRDWVPEDEFRLYQQVVPSACILLDRLLHRLVQAAGKETAIVIASAHGVNQRLPPHYLRAGDSEIWKSPYGILAACGPDFNRDSLVLGATIHDVAPTILTWFGLPIGDDMEGRVLMESFTAVPEVARVGSWEPEPQRDPKTINAASGPSPDHPAAERLRLEYDWNLARSCLDAARYDEALPLLEKLFRSFPERSEFGHALFQCQLTVKNTAEAGQTLDILLEGIPPGIWSLLPRVELLIATGNRKEARLLVEEIQNLKPAEPEALRRLGMILWRLREWKALAELAQEALKLDENEALAWLALAEATLRLRQPSEAIEAALRAIGLNYFLPQAHLVLSRALLTQGRWAEAREAIQTVLRLQPNNRAATAYSRRSGLDGEQPETG